MPNIGDLIIRKAAGVWVQIGTVIRNDVIGGKTYSKILHVSTEDYPVSTDDFYESYVDFDNLYEPICVINSVEDIPQDFL